jgi:hypothetical protein
MWKFAGFFRRYGTFRDAVAPHGQVSSEPALSSIFSPVEGGRVANGSGSLRPAVPGIRRPTNGNGYGERRPEKLDPDAGATTVAPVAAEPRNPPERDRQPPPAEPPDRAGPEPGGEPVAQPVALDGVGEPFVETDSDKSMSRSPDAPIPVQNSVNGGAPAPAPAPDDPANARQARDSLVGKVVCPFCGQQKSASSEPCPRCTMEDTPATRQATKARIGPWYVLQNRSPSAPGMKFATMLWLVNKGHITPRSIVRGPTTYQLWRYAAHVRGLSREFGLCYSCGGEIDKSASICAHCERPNDPPSSPDVLLDVRDGAPPPPMAPVRETAPRPPVMREVGDAPDPRREAEARRKPPAPVRDDAHEHQDEPDEHADVAATVGAEPSHAERMRLHNEIVVRQRQDILRRGGGGRMVSAMDLAAALQDPSEAADGSRRWGALNLLLFFLVLFGGAAAAVLYLKPEYRQPTAKWVSGTWNTIRTKAASLQWSSPPGEPPANSTRIAVKQQQQQQQQQQHSPPAPVVTREPEPAKNNALAQQSKAAEQEQTKPPVHVAKKDESRKDEPPRDAEPEHTAAQPQPQPQPRTPDPSAAQLARGTAGAEVAPEQPKSQPQVQQDPPPREEPKQAAAPAPNNRQNDRRNRLEQAERPRDDQQRQAERQDQRQAQREPEPSEADSLDTALAKSRELYNQGIDAEARGDWSAAVRFYEQIKKLPRGAWQGDLQHRLNFARKNAESKSKSAEAR